MGHTPQVNALTPISSSKNSGELPGALPVLGGTIVDQAAYASNCTADYGAFHTAGKSTDYGSRGSTTADDCCRLARGPFWPVVAIAVPVVPAVSIA